MSVASLFKGNFMEGGPFFMTLHFIMWILVTIYTIRFLRNYYSGNRNSKKLRHFNFTIIFIGAFGFIFSLFHRTIGIYSAMTAIEKAGDISPAILAGGYRVSLISPLYALFLFLVTSIIWFVFKNMIRE